jgi:hypothetical protein
LRSYLCQQAMFDGNALFLKWLAGRGLFSGD